MDRRQDSVLVVVVADCVLAIIVVTPPFQLVPVEAGNQQLPRRDKVVANIAMNAHRSHRAILSIRVYILNALVAPAATPNAVKNVEDWFVLEMEYSLLSPFLNPLAGKNAPQSGAATPLLLLLPLLLPAVTVALGPTVPVVGAAVPATSATRVALALRLVVALRRVVPLMLPVIPLSILSP